MNLPFRILVILILLITAVLGGVGLFGSTEVEPKAWKAPIAPSLDEVPWSAAKGMDGTIVFGQANLMQPESVAADSQGRLYTGMNTGEIVRLNPAELALKDNPATAPFELIANTQGRPLGMDMHPDGTLIVADAIKGLIRVGMDGKVTVLSTEADGVKYRFADDVAVSADGTKAWFSDASSKFAYPHFTQDIIEHAGNGRLIEYDFESGRAKVLLDGLNFANGVEVDPQERFVLVNETGSYQVLRYWLEGQKAGQSDVFIDNLPGFPDNIRADTKGRFWVAIPGLRDPLLDGMSDKPGLRKVLARFLEHVDFPVKPNAMAIALNDQGQVVDVLKSEKANGYYYITQVTPVQDRLYFNSVHLNGMAYITHTN